MAHEPVTLITETKSADAVTSLVAWHRLAELGCASCLPTAYGVSFCLDRDALTAVLDKEGG